MSSCAAYEIWKEATRIMKEYFDSVSLQDMVIIARKKSKRPVRMARRLAQFK
jgi:DNA-binding IscR family transcriptional regulator